MCDQVSRCFPRKETAGFQKENPPLALLLFIAPPTQKNMASLDTDINMVPVGEGSSSAGPSSSSSKKPKRFEIKKWNAVALWAWGTFS